MQFCAKINIIKAKLINNNHVCVNDFKANNVAPHKHHNITCMAKYMRTLKSLKRLVNYSVLKIFHSTPTERNFTVNSYGHYTGQSGTVYV